MKQSPYQIIQGKPPFPRAADDSSLNPTHTQQKLTKLMLGVANNLQNLGRKTQGGKEAA